VFAPAEIHLFAPSQTSRMRTRSPATPGRCADSRTSLRPPRARPRPAPSTLDSPSPTRTSP
jgi:hypothetical protein